MVKGFCIEAGDELRNPIAGASPCSLRLVEHGAFIAGERP
jgi:hypothetical protein